MTQEWYSLSKAGELLLSHDFHLGKLKKGQTLFREILQYTPHRELMLDVGAHIGYMGEAAAPHFKEVHCFEPAPDCFEVLARNLQKHANVKLHNIALGPFSGECSVRNDPDRPYSQASRFVVPLKGGATTMAALDDLNLTGRGLLKIDVEGFELQVLQGAKWYIKSYRPTIFMETSKVWSSKHPYIRDHAKAERWLLEHDYKVAKRFPHDTIFVHV